MRRAFVFVATLAAVPIAGAAFACMATPGADRAKDPAEVVGESAEK